MLAFGLLAAWLARRAAASVRALVLASTFAAAAVLPVAVWLAPSLTVPVPGHVAPALPAETTPLPAWRDSEPEDLLAPVPIGDVRVGRLPNIEIDAGTTLRAIWILGILAVLVPLAERLSGREARPILAMAGRTDLSARVEAILDEARPRRRADTALVVAAACLVVLCLAMVAPLTAGRDAQAPGQEQLTPRPAFEVASIRRQDGVQVPSGPPARPPAVTAQFDRLNATVVSLIQFAYGVRAAEILGGPDWARNDRFQISARAATPVGPEQMQLMVQSLLEDRFHLVLRTEPREMRYFDLVRLRDDRLGPGLEGCDDPAAAANAPPGPPVRVPAGGMPWQQRCQPLSALANGASGMLGSPIFDRTGLDGLWSFTFMFLQPNLPPGPQRDMAAQEGTPSFEAAVREHLGLMFESRRGPVEVLVIDSVEPPSEN